MAIVFTRTRRYVVGDRTVHEGKVTFTGATSYVTGGLSTVAADYGFRGLDHIDVLGSHGGSCFIDDDSAGTLKLKLTTAVGGVTEVAGSGDPTGITLHVKAFGY